MIVENYRMKTALVLLVVLLFIAPKIALALATALVVAFLLGLLKISVTVESVNDKQEKRE